jgi:ketosteroid isomerase-like protein
MWDERLNVVQAFVAAITERDVEAALELYHAEIEYFPLMAQLVARPYRGFAGIRRSFKDIDATWEEWRLEVEQLVSAPDGRVVIVTSTPHARQGERASIRTASRAPVGVQGREALARHAAPGSRRRRASGPRAAARAVAATGCGQRSGNEV